jgi:predicted permease
MVQNGTVAKDVMLMRGLWAFLLSLVLQSVMMAISYLTLRKKQEEARYRIFVIAATFSNSGFFGVPILKAVLGEAHPEVVMVSALFSLVMNMMCWTVVSTVITRDPKYISLKKIFINPNTIAGIIAITLMCLDFVFPTQVEGMITLLGNFSTPLCMFILGMRLALVKPRELFGDWRQYVVVLCKNVACPALALAALLFAPIDGYIKQALFIIVCCPAANMVLSFAEMLGKGQKTAANLLLLSTIASLVTLPLMCILLPLLA